MSPAPGAAAGDATARITVRRASPADADGLAAVAERTFRDTFAGDNLQGDMDAHCTRSFAAAIQQREISDPARVTLLAEADGLLVGFAQLLLRSHTPSLSAQRPCELNRIYVLKPWHGRRVAQQLMTAALSAASQAASDHLWLGVWERNPRAIAFYRKLGFKVTGAHTFTLGSEAQRDLIMAAALEPAALAGCRQP
jgi:diamine N-acetyltransferase